MLQQLRYLFGKSEPRPVFVVGSGRSGTHWLGFSLGDHPEVRATIEKKPMFKLATRMAVNPDLEEHLFDNLVRAYKWELFLSGDKVYLDKSHPNLWLAEKLKAAFPTARFVGIERNPFATAASMIKHKRVSEWHTRWREFPVPNRFLGISEEQATTYDALPLPTQCALRWVAHHERMTELRQTLGDDLMVIDYEAFAHQPAKVIETFQRFLGLEKPIPVPDVRVQSLDKWKAQFDNEAIQQIADVVGFSPTDLRPEQAAPDS